MLSGLSKGPTVVKMSKSVAASAIYMEDSEVKLLKFININFIRKK